MNRIVAHYPSEAELTKEIHHIVKTLMKEGKLSGNPEDVIIERVSRHPIKPCRRSKEPNSFNLTQLEWAENEGRFWFPGPIKSLMINLGNGRIRKTYASELDRIYFETVVNELNYDDFAELTSNLKTIARDLGLNIELLPGKGPHEANIKISTDKPMSETSVKEFLQGVEKVLKTI